MEKVYELPALAPAPASDLQALLRRFIEYADWSAVRPLLDCLNDAGRHDDAREVRWVFGQFFGQQADSPDWACDRLSWRFRMSRDLVGLFAFDLFAPEACVAAMRSVNSYEDVLPMDAAVGVPANSGVPWFAEGDISNGDQVAMDYGTRTVRVHPAPVPAAAEGA